jgi:hypothetical protein
LSQEFAGKVVLPSATSSPAVLSTAPGIAIDTYPGVSFKAIKRKMLMTLFGEFRSAPISRVRLPARIYQRINYERHHI